MRTAAAFFFILQVNTYCYKTVTYHHHRDTRLVVAVRYQVRADLGQGERQPRVRLGRGGEGGDLHVEILAQVRVLRVRRGAQLLLLRQSEVRTEVT